MSGAVQSYSPRPAGYFPLVRDVFDVERLADIPRGVFESVKRSFEDPFVGITTGTLTPGLFGLAAAASTASMSQAAAAYLALLDPAAVAEGRLPVDSPAWRQWTNAYPVWPPHGLLLADLNDGQREAALSVIRESLSPRGARETRDCMRLNAVLGEVVDAYPETLTEWMYRFTVFGEPSRTEPWGWQLAGHHLDVHCFVLGDQIVLTPTFMGAEVRVAESGPYAGLRLFDDEEQLALTLMQSLDASQRDRAVLFPSMRSGDLPEELRHPTEGRMRTVAGADNLVLPYEGLSAVDLSDDQRSALVAVIATYIGRLPAGHREARMAEIVDHLDSTHFTWVGEVDDHSPFYYKIHSPVLIIEFDHHAGVFLSNEEPERLHVHTIVRTPNGNDYGRDLLRQHYERYHGADGPPARREFGV